MHIIGIIVGVIVFIVVWWSRLKMLNEVATKAADVVDTAVKAPRRWRFRRQISENPADTMDDPRNAAVTLLYLLAASDGILTENEEKLIRQQAFEKKLCEEKDWDDYSVYGRWAVGRMSGDQKNAKKLIKTIARLAPDAGDNLRDMVSALGAGTCDEDLRAEVLSQIGRSFKIQS